MTKGDKIYCIDNSDNTKLYLDKIYTVYSVSFDKTHIKLENKPLRYYASRFITFDEHRRNKILKLKERIDGNR